MLRVLSLVALGLLAIAPPLGAGPVGQKAPAASPDAMVIADFQKRVTQYLTVHQKLEDTLPKLPKQTNPQEIDTHQRSLAKLLQTARKTARPGAVLTPAMQRLIRNRLRPIFLGEDGRQVKDEILDKEYKGNVKLAVNGRYPDEVPISTVPPQVLGALPTLPEELEYRFIQNSLILFDNHAHLIVDFMGRAFL